MEVAFVGCGVDGGGRHRHGGRTSTYVSVGTAAACIGVKAWKRVRPVACCEQSVKPCESEKRVEQREDQVREGWRRYCAALVLAALVWGNDVAGLAWDGAAAIRPRAAFALSEPQKLVAEAWRVVDQGYVDRTFNNQDWFKIRMKEIKKPLASMDDAYAVITEMLKTLGDPYTRFLNPSQFNSLTSSATGELAGVGLEMYPALVDNKLVVLSPIDGSPAFKAGIRSQDVITLIDGESTEDLTPDEAAARIRGTPGTRVSLYVIHASTPDKEVRYDLVRESLKIVSVKSELLPGNIGVLRIKQFNSSTPDDARAALEKLRAKGAKKYVIDLRNNPGGYFPAGVDVARLFLPKDKPVVFVVNKNGIQDEYDVLEEPLIADEPIVVLVNKATASASEILSGALKDNRRALLVGEKTFGKGVVQTVTGLSDGSGVAVTIAKYETPAHVDINKKGIVPDIESKCAEDEVLACLPKDF
ncbi:Carboxyl-terminal-processing protease [Porphyridium purpureum]|uniref:C-terminal processing peptidase n=1 Tax=Porphyridium purpureum TaxID=35688 RepID=A0A5J4YTJ8_PORPP|nr:Carboxyl-terminal-processing protease [Porphyridium purpureum]|eukprot:POR8313..scf227_4